MWTQSVNVEVNSGVNVSQMHWRIAATNCKGIDFELKLKTLKPQLLQCTQCETEKRTLKEKFKKKLIKKYQFTITLKAPKTIFCIKKNEKPQ